MKGIEEQLARYGLKVIWIGFQDKKEKIIKFMEMHGVKSGVIYDDGNQIAKSYGIRYGAGLVVIDKEGTVKARVPKGFSERNLNEALNKVIAVQANQDKMKERF